MAPGFPEGHTTGKDRKLRGGLKSVPVLRATMPSQSEVFSVLDIIWTQLLTKNYETQGLCPLENACGFTKKNLLVHVSDEF